MNVSVDRIRLALDTSLFTSPTDVVTSAPPQFWNGTNVRFELGLVYNGLIIPDVSNVDSITVLVKDSNSRSGRAMMSKTISSADIDRTVTDATWQDGSKQHVVVAFDHTETVMAVQGIQSNFWMVISAVINSGTGSPQTIVIGAGTIVVSVGGQSVTTPSSVSSPTYLTADESDARYLATLDLSTVNYNISTKMPIAGGTFTGVVTFAASATNFSSDPTSATGYKVAGIRVIGAQGASVTDSATIVAAVSPTACASLETTQALQATVQTLITRLRAHGIIAT